MLANRYSTVNGLLNGDFSGIHTEPSNFES